MKLRPLKWLIEGVEVKTGKSRRTDWMLCMVIGPHETKEEATKTQKHLEQVIRESNDDMLLAQDEGIIT